MGLDAADLFDLPRWFIHGAAVEALVAYPAPRTSDAVPRTSDAVPHTSDAFWT
jgi:hypothetical protein